MDKKINEALIAKPGSPHTRQPTVFAPMLSRDPEHLKRVERMAWNAEVDLQKKAKRMSKIGKKRNENAGR